MHLTELLSAFPSRRTPRRRLCAGCISRGGGHPAGSAGGCPGGTDAAGCATRQGRPGISSGRGTSPARPEARRRPIRSFPPSARPVWNRASPACTSPQHPGQPLCHRVPHRPEGRQPLHGHVLRLCRRQERPEGHLSLKSQNNFQSPEQKMPAPGFLCDLLTEKRRSLGYTVPVR